MLRWACHFFNILHVFIFVRKCTVLAHKMHDITYDNIYYKIIYITITITADDILWKFQLKRRISDRFIARINDQRLKIEKKKLTTMDILEHWAFNITRSEISSKVLFYLHILFGIFAVTCSWRYNYRLLRNFIAKILYFVHIYACSWLPVSNFNSLFTESLNLRCVL